MYYKNIGEKVIGERAVIKKNESFLRPLLHDSTESGLYKAFAESRRSLQNMALIHAFRQTTINHGAIEQGLHSWENRKEIIDWQGQDRKAFGVEQSIWVGTSRLLSNPALVAVLLKICEQGVEDEEEGDRAFFSYTLMQVGLTLGGTINSIIYDALKMHQLEYRAAEVFERAYEARIRVLKIGCNEEEIQPPLISSETDPSVLQGLDLISKTMSNALVVIATNMDTPGKLQAPMSASIN